MQNEKLPRFFQAQFPMSPDVAATIAAKFEPIEVAKNDFLLKENKISRFNYFLESGVIRSFALDTNGNEVTTQIFMAPTFANDFLSLFTQKPTAETYQALTDCQIWRMSHEEVQKSFHAIPEFREMGRLMLVRNYAKLHARMIGMIRDTAETRYLDMMTQYPEIFQYVPLKMIASYLGVTDTSLSRIRKKLAHR